MMRPERLRERTSLVEREKTSMAVWMRGGSAAAAEPRAMAANSRANNMASSTGQLLQISSLYTVRQTRVQRALRIFTSGKLPGRAVCRQTAAQHNAWLWLGSTTTRHDMLLLVKGRSLLYEKLSRY